MGRRRILPKEASFKQELVSAPGSSSDIRQAPWSRGVLGSQRQGQRPHRLFEVSFISGSLQKLSAGPPVLPGWPARP